MDAFWMIKSSFSLFGTQLARNQQKLTNIFDDVLGFVHSMAKTIMKKCLMPCPFTGPKMFCACPNFLSQPKNYLHIVPLTNILCQTKRCFAFSKIGFCASTNVFEQALNAVKYLAWLKRFGQAQNILGPVKGQGIRGPK